RPRRRYGDRPLRRSTEHLSGSGTTSELDVGPYGAYNGKIVSATPLTGQEFTLHCHDASRTPPDYDDSFNTGPLAFAMPVRGSKQVYSIACTDKDFVIDSPQLKS